MPTPFFWFPSTTQIATNLNSSVMCDLTPSQLDLGLSQFSQIEPVFGLGDSGVELSQTSFVGDSSLSQFTLSQPPEEQLDNPESAVKATTLSQVSFDNDPELLQFASLSQEQ